MTAIRAGTLTALFLYDVAEAARLGSVGTIIGSAVPARLAPRPDTPAYLQYLQPPLSIDGDDLGLAAVEDCRVRFKVFDCGVISDLHDDWIAEDYLVVGVYDVDLAPAAEELIIVGDGYAARLFTLAGARLGLDQWKADVRDRLETLDAIYRFAVEQASMTRGQLLEVMVVLILLFELVFFVRDLLA